MGDWNTGWKEYKFLIAGFLVSIAIAGCHSPQVHVIAGRSKKDTGMIGQVDKTGLVSFSETYANPVVAGSRETGIPGLKVIYVYDKSWEAEDPLIPAAWLELETGEKFGLTEAGISISLGKLRFIPKTESDALRVARISSKDSYSDGNRIVFDDEDPFPVPSMSFEYDIVTRLGLAKPEVTREGSNFKVDFHVYHDPKEWRRFGPDNAKPSISHERILVGPATYLMIKSEVIWPDSMKLQVKQNPH